ncbi:MAG: GNAT family N-acetyltransferase [Candidatus Omnitrophica bacterium]|nr:GNAT family N-acetyltransferase [Candidatus Omnitrophota bacterium]
MIDCWTLKQVLFEYKFGMFKLFSIALKAIVFDTHFIKLLPSCGSLPTPPPPAAHTGDCAFILGYPISKPLSRLSRIPSYLRYVPYQSHHYYISMQGSFNQYLNKFNHKSRYNILRSVRLYQDFAQNKKPWKEYTRVDEMEEFQRLARTVAIKTYQERLLGDGIPAGEIFLNQLKELASRDSIRCYILFLGSKPIAYLSCPVVHNTAVLYDYVGYDPDYRKWSPGTVLQYYTLKRLFEEERYEVFDFMRGGAPDSHKKIFSSHDVLCADIYYFKYSVRNLAIIFFHVVIRTASEWFTKFLDILQIKFRLKRILKEICTYS